VAAVAQGRPEGSRRGGGGRAGEEAGELGKKNASGVGVGCPHEKMDERATGPARFLPFSK